MSNDFEMACPNRGDADRADVQATVWVRLTEDGTDADQASPDRWGHEWADCSAAQWAGCGHLGTVASFTT